eukprot:188173-Chlamydomonas_euryale.AAC.5
MPVPPIQPNLSNMMLGSDRHIQGEACGHPCLCMALTPLADHATNPPFTTLHCARCAPPGSVLTTPPLPSPCLLCPALLSADHANPPPPSTALAVHRPSQG